MSTVAVLLAVTGETFPFVCTDDIRRESGSKRSGDILGTEEFATVDGREARPSAQHNRKLEW